MGAPSYKCCNGKLRSNEWDPSNREKMPPGQWAGPGYCKWKAGQETDHVGEGRCKHHGGKGGTPVKHGLYSSGLRQEIRQSVDKAEGKDQPGDMWKEVAVLRGLLDRYLSRLDEVGQEDLQNVSKIQSEVRKTINTIHEMMMRTRPTEQEVDRLVSGFADILKTYVDEESRRAALEDLRSLTGTDT